VRRHRPPLAVALLLGLLPALAAGQAPPVSTEAQTSKPAAEKKANTLGGIAGLITAFGGGSAIAAIVSAYAAYKNAKKSSQSAQESKSAVDELVKDTGRLEATLRLMLSDSAKSKDIWTQITQHFTTRGDARSSLAEALFNEFVATYRGSLISLLEDHSQVALLAKEGIPQAPKLSPEQEELVEAITHGLGSFLKGLKK
jgi:hypothetical protein